MTDKKTSAAQLRAAQKYKREKIKRITVEFSPAEADLWEHINSQPKKQTYIKSLIRVDMGYGEEKKDELYGILKEEIKAAHKEGIRSKTTRYDLCKVLDGWFGRVTRDDLEVIERLCADNLIDP